MKNASNDPIEELMFFNYEEEMETESVDSEPKSMDSLFLSSNVNLTQHSSPSLSKPNSPTHHYLSSSPPTHTHTGTDPDTRTDTRTDTGVDTGGLEGNELPNEKERKVKNVAFKKHRRYYSISSIDQFIKEETQITKSYSILYLNNLQKIVDR